MRRVRLWKVIVLLVGCVQPLLAQPAEEPPPAWQLDAGASFVATGGNSQTSTLGAELVYQRVREAWRFDAEGSAVRASEEAGATAERYLARTRIERALTARLALSAGWRGERDRFAGLNLRSTTTLGVRVQAVDTPRWKLGFLPGLTWERRNPVGGRAIEDFLGAALETDNRFILSPTAETRQRFVLYPNLSELRRYHLELDLSLSAALNSLLSVKLGYLLRYDHLPVPTFERTDTSFTAALVLKLQAER